MNRDAVIGWSALAVSGAGSLGVAHWDPVVAAWLGLWWGFMAFLMCFGLARKVIRAEQRLDVLEAKGTGKLSSLVRGGR